MMHGESYDAMAMLRDLEGENLDPSAVDERLAMWERHLDRTLEMHNGFTNNGRFEQIPSGPPIQVPSAPLFVLQEDHLITYLWSGVAFCVTILSQSKLTRACTSRP